MDVKLIVIIIGSLVFTSFSVVKIYKAISDFFGFDENQNMKFLLIKRSKDCEKIEKEISTYIKFDTEDMGCKYDGIIVIGKDSTVLDTILNKPHPPVIYAVDEGYSGWLCPIDESEVQLLAKKLKKKEKIEIIKRERLTLNGKINFINEVLIKSNESKMGCFKITINGLNLIISGDAVIVATKTGSTGYNASIGGPILLTDAMVINVVSPNRCNFKPLVCDMSSNVKVELIYGDPLVLVDGITTKEKKVNVSYSDSFVEFGYLSRKRMVSAVSDFIHMN